ncbi:MAG TPA: hypothetical protein VFT04_00735 [Gemmatimonadales bacterium]|nr:hypothetical protein [Gemmatimonadales bacterium]
MKRVTVQHRGRTYEAEIRPGEEVGAGADPTAAEVWHVTREGFTVTTFPVSDGEKGDSIREKIVEWLIANEDRPDADVGRQ